VDRSINFRRYDDRELHALGELHRGWPGPDILAVLHDPSTASSGRSDTWSISGFTYGFFFLLASGCCGVSLLIVPASGWLRLFQ
jgi:hypothetical protein